jgi:hypothetical protein
VNLGVNGYGLDQAYLRYRRDLEGIDHDVHVFAFIADDFRRMRDGLFRGGPKPTLVIEDGRLAVQGVPVPRLSSARVLMRRVRDQAVINFRSLELVRRLFPFLGRKTCAWNGEGGGGPSDSLRPVVDKLFGALSDATTTRDAALVLTYLPCVDEYRPAEVPQWRAVAREMAVRHGIPFVDLSLDLNDLPREKAEGFFIGGFVREPFVMADGHYTVNGNAFFARALYRRLRDIPVVAAQLNRVPERMAEGDSGTP